MMNHPSKEGGLFVSTPIQNIFDICNYLRKIYLDFSYKNVIFVLVEIWWENGSPVETD